MANFSVNFPEVLLGKLNDKSRETGMTGSDLVRLAVASFLAKEDALEEYLAAIERIDGKLIVLTKRQELFARAIGSVSASPDSVRSRELAEKLSDKFNQIIDTTGGENASN